MKNIFRKFPPAIFPFLLLAAGLVSACGNSSSILQGSAGQPTATVEAPATAEDVPTPEVPTSAPIPAPVGHIIFVSNRDGQMNLYRTTPDGLEVNRLTTNNSQDVNPRISPDGTRIAFVSTVNNNMDIYILDLASLGITRLTDAPEKDAAPTWSPDGTRLAFESFRDGNFEIYTVNADGSNLMRLTNDLSADSAPVWSPASNEIVFVTGRFGNSDLMLVDTNGTVSTLTTSPSPDNAPAWSPDGAFIAFKSYAGDLSNLCVIGRDALNQRCITPAADDYGAPVWSPDGTLIASNHKDVDIQIFNIQSGEVTQMSQSGIEPRGAPVWSPEGLRLVFQAQVNGDLELVSAFIPTNEFSQITFYSGYDGEPIWGLQ